MLQRSGIIANGKKVYRLMTLANLVRKRSIRKYVIIKSTRKTRPTLAAKI
jgi:hypothetical protein